ncbi:MAG: ABC transporter permease [Firmicutes bacterium]|nr:ABC transporter permease [Bacillota bacterium]
MGSAGVVQRAGAIIYIIWLREIKTFIRERARIVGMIAQPLLYLLVMGKGLASAMSLDAAPGGLDYVKFMYPGIIGMSILFTSIFSAVSIIWDREFGFLKEVLVAPVPRWGVAVGKSWGGATVALFQSAILISLAPLLGIRLTPGLVVRLLPLAFLISFAITSMGVAIAARMESMQGFQMVMNFLVMPLFFLSGAMFPVSSAPAWMKNLMVINPLSYGIDGLRNVIFSETMITLEGGLERPLAEVAVKAGLIRWDLGTDILIMVLVALVLTVVGAYSLNRVE